MSLTIPMPAGATPSGIVNIKLTDIEAWALNPRKTFDEEALEQLARSITEQGVLQNIVVRRLRPETNEGEQNFRYQVVAGERRWRASQMAKLDSIPARILSDMTSDADAFEIALRENTDRQGLAPLDEAEGYQKFLMLAHIRQEDLGTRLGVSQSAISNSLRLLRLPEPVREKIREGQLSKAVALVLCKLVDYPSDCAEIAFMAAAESYTQRQVATLVDARWHKLESSKKERDAILPLPLDDTPTPPVAQTATVDAPDDSDPDEQPATPVVPAEERYGDEDMEDPFAGEDDENAGDATATEDTASGGTAETAKPPAEAPAATEPGVDAVVPAPAPQAVTPPVPTPAPAAPAPAPAPAPPKTAAPTETVTAPTGPMIAASISQATDDWLFEQDLTLDQAIREMQKYRLTPLGKQASEALTDFYNKDTAEAITIGDYLEAVLVARAQKAGLMGGEEREG